VDSEPIFCRQVLASTLKVVECFPNTRPSNPHWVVCLSDPHFGEFYLENRKVVWLLFKALWHDNNTLYGDVRALMDSTEPIFGDTLREELRKAPGQAINFWFSVDSGGRKTVHGISCVDFVSPMPHLLEDIASYYKDKDDGSGGVVAIVLQHYRDACGPHRMPALVIRRPGLGFINILCHEERRLLISGVSEFVSPCNDDPALGCGDFYWRVRPSRWTIIKTKSWAANYDEVISTIDSKWDELEHYSALQFSEHEQRLLDYNTQNDKARREMRSAELDTLEFDAAKRAKNYLSVSNSFSSLDGGEKE